MISASYRFNREPTVKPKHAGFKGVFGIFFVTFSFLKSANIGTKFVA
jgi:hypothetical protein